jgi:hydrogenase-4 component F
VLRFFQVAVATGQRSFAEHVLIVFGVLALVLASFSVIRQGNYKRLLAYSSIEHMGIIAIGIGFGTPLAVIGALLHVITHASAKGLAFFGAGSLLRGYDTKQVDEVTDAAHRMPFTGPMFLTAALALCGLPLSGVFRSEFDIVCGGFAEPQYVGVTLLLIFVNIAFFGIIWHAGRMVLSSGDSTTTDRQDSVAERSGWMIAGMLGLLFVVVALGVHLPGDLSALLRNASHRLEHAS